MRGIRSGNVAGNSDLNDEDLIARFRSGDVAAFNTLVQRWHARIYNFVLRYVGDRDEAKDVAQQTFVSAYRGLKRLDDASLFSSWLYRIAVNQCHDAGRRAARSRTVSVDDDSASIAPLIDEGPGTDALVHETDMRDVLRRALQSIPEEQRVVVIMKEYEGLKFREIAEALDVPINTVKSRMYYGLDALRKVFDRWQVTGEMLRYES